MKKSDLQRYRAINAEVQQLRSQLRVLESRAGSPTGQRSSRTPAGREDGDRTMDSLVDRLDHLRRLYHDRVSTLLDGIAKVEAEIGRLEDPVERMVLRYRYVQGLPWGKICQAMNCSEREAHRLHTSALQHMCPRPEALADDDHTCSGALDE